jgi:hypothetical protein
VNRRMVRVLAGLLAAAVLVLGGAAFARAGLAPFDDGEQQLAGPEADRARAAALRITGGGTANAVERDGEQGATYEVEVTRTDGSTVDVRLDRSFNLVTVDGDGEQADGDDR